MARGMIASDWDIAKQDGADIVEPDNFLFPNHLTEFVNIRVIPWVFFLHAKKPLELFWIYTSQHMTL